MQRLQLIQPRRLFVACDGPSPAQPDVAVACQETREVIESGITWPCEVKKLYRNEQRGCRRGVAEALDWFFSQVEAGIILEDDVLPDPSFFPYCAELLDRYHADERVAMISGCTIRNLPPRDGSSYRFSRFCHVWGWASWRRAWNHYDAEMVCWSSIRDQGWLDDLGGRRFARYWRHQFDRVWMGECDTWDYIWMLSCWRGNRLCILPALNLVENLGFSDPRATHTALDRSPLPPAASLPFPLRHPEQQIIDHRLDGLDLARYYAPSFPRRLLRRLQRDAYRLWKALCTGNA